MNTRSSPPTLPALGLPQSAPTAAAVVFRLLRRLRHGTLDIQLPDGSLVHAGSDAPGEPRAVVCLRNWNVCGAALRSGDIGFAETYIDGDWSTPDLPSLLKLFVANRDEIAHVVYGTWWGSALHRLRHLFNRNTRSGSRRNIHAHYDLGNAFYRLWLDPTMNYSSAWFDGDLEQPLADAQNAKLKRALAQAGVKRGDRVLEIGCGWGALAECAAREFGASVVGVSLSGEQLDWARQRLAAAGLEADLRFQDYRDIDDGPFDAVLSIEMFEAVGHRYWPAFFAALHRQLKPGAKACIQTITIRDDLFDRYLRSTDFIQQYIFPGGLLPSAAEFRKAADAAGLEIVEELEFGPDYAETLKRWRERFTAAGERVRQLKFDSRFIRTWDFYLAYCEAAFAMKNTGVMQFTLRRPV